MTKRKLAISPALSLPLDVVVGTHAILGRKRTGKTYKAKVLAEEMLEAHQQIIVIDPTDAWWGLRSSADGRSQGHAITIFGGRHGDLPLDPGGGAELAHAIIEDGFSAIFSLKGMTNAEEQRFCTAFLETLYKDNEQKPIHIFMDEADLYAPQSPLGEEMRTLGATKKIVLRAGLDGLGITLISQRPAHVAKSVLTQCDTMIALGLSHPADLKPIGDWAKVQVKSIALAKEMLEDLPDLPKGDAWIWSPHHQIRQRVTFRDLHTFDSSRSPKPGERMVKPRVLSKVDLTKLGKRIADSVEKAKENDPKELRKRLVKLHHENLTLAAQLGAAATKGAKSTGSSKEKIVERAVIPAKQLARIEQLVAQGSGLVERWDNRSADAFAMLDKVREQTGKHFRLLDDKLTELSTALRSASLKIAPSASRPVVSNGERKVIQRQVRAALPPTPTNGITRTAPVTPSASDETLRPAQQKIINAIHVLRNLHGTAPTKGQVALVAEQSPTSGNYQNYLGKLRSMGLVDYPSAGHVDLTDLGIGIVDADVVVPQTTVEIHRFVRRLVGESKWKIMEPLISRYPDSFPKADLADAAGMSPTSGNYQNYLGRLRSQGFLDYPSSGQVRAEDILFVEPARA